MGDMVDYEYLLLKGYLPDSYQILQKFHRNAYNFHRNGGKVEKPPVCNGSIISTPSRPEVSEEDIVKNWHRLATFSTSSSELWIRSTVLTEDVLDTVDEKELKGIRLVLLKSKMMFLEENPPKVNRTKVKTPRESMRKSKTPGKSKRSSIVPMEVRGNVSEEDLRVLRLKNLFVKA